MLQLKIKVTIPLEFENKVEDDKGAVFKQDPDWQDQRFDPTKLEKKVKTVFPCGICPDKTYTRRADLKRHQETAHAGEQPFKCNICGKGARKQSELKRHIEVKHEGKKPHSCEKCGKGFVKRETLKLHYVKGCGEEVKVQKCTSCDFSCQFETELRAHLERSVWLLSF